MPANQILSSFAAAAVLAVLSFFAGEPALSDTPAELVLRDATGKEIFSTFLGDGSFAIRYTHSVAQTPVTDFFHARIPDIVLDKTEYQDFGAGLPHMPEAGQTMCTCNGKIVISGYNRKMRGFDIRVGRVANHCLLLPNESGAGEIPLNTLLPPGQAINFSVR